MKLCAVFMAIVCVGALQASDEKDSASKGESLFDGKTLKGWEGDEAFFRIEDGSVVGGSLTKPVPHNAFLCTKEEFGNFDLRVRFKLVGKGANAGVQFRSERIPNHFEVSGYQADMGGPFWGCLYDESRRNKVLVEPIDRKALKAALKMDDWNDYRILCEGPRIQLWINGIQTVDYTENDDKIPQRGVIGLQIHGGGPSEVRYKDIFIDKLK